MAQFNKIGKQLHLFLTSAQVVGVWVTSQPDRCDPGKVPRHPSIGRQGGP